VTVHRTRWLSASRFRILTACAKMVWVFCLLIAAATLAQPVQSVCSIHYYNNTLVDLNPDGVTMLYAADSAACCDLCQTNSSCQTWCFSGAKWTPRTPCHLSSYPPSSVTPTSGANYSAGSATTVTDHNVFDDVSRWEAAFPQCE
jgi:hypothetical protein